MSECAICGDEARVGRVLAVDSAERTAEVEVSGIVRSVAIDLIENMAADDHILIHQGFAIAKVASAPAEASHAGDQ